MYTPKAMNARPEDLPEELQPVLEQLAEAVHDNWAAGRLAEGWTYGPNRDDTARTHPDLLPYAELEESERAFDRSTAAQTIQSLLDLGYRILPAESEEKENG